MPYLHIDFETKSECDLSTKGNYTYSQHPSTDIILGRYIVLDSPKHLSAVSHEMHELQGREGGARLMKVAADTIAAGGKLCAFNAMFEYYIWNNVGTRRYGWVPTDIEDWLCVMQQAACANLPQGLGQLSHRLNLPVVKQDIGALLIGDLSLLDPEQKAAYMKRVRASHKKKKQQDLVDAFDMLTDDDKLTQMGKYCDADVMAQAHAWAAMPPTTTVEHRYQVVTNRMNERGVQVDLSLVAKVREIALRRTAEITEEVKAVTRGAVTSPKARKSPLEWLDACGVKVPTKRQASGKVSKSLDGTAIRRLLMKDDLPPECRRFLELKRQANKSSLAKLEVLLNSTGNDGRYRGSLVYAGASQTARWSNRGAQLHNLPRGVFKSTDDYDMALSAARDGDYDLLELTWGADRLMDVCSSLIRPCILPAPGCEFIISDYSQIEPRVAFWLAGQDDLLEAFRQGRDLYAVIAAEAYNCSYEEAKEDSSIRQFGKIAVLAGNYRGGAGTFQTFAFMYGIILTAAEAQDMVGTYRDVIDQVVNYWYEIQDAAYRAVRSPGTVIGCGRIKFHSTSRCLRMLLPSNRCLYYWKPRIEKVVAPWADDPDNPTPKDMIDALCYTNHNGRTHTHGGKLFENAVQAVSRDPMADALVRLDEAGLCPVLTVHDEAGCETPAGQVDLAQVDELMCQVPAWAEGLPLDTDTHAANYYLKC